MTETSEAETGEAGPAAASAIGARDTGMRSFLHLLSNTLVASVTTNFLWFALTFWVYLETRSVMTTALIGGAYMLLVAASGMFFGTVVDRTKKKHAMIMSATVTLASYLIAGAVFLTIPEERLVDWTGPLFWAFSGVILVGSVVENLRNIALSTSVTLLVPPDRRDRANGLVGTAHGISFMITSVFSGLAIGYLGMGATVLISIVLTAIAFVHLLLIPIREQHPARGEHGERARLREVFPAIMVVPGLLALLLFSTFNNLVGGVFMALMDPYGLTLFSVQVWGIMLGITSIGFIIGGALVAKFGLGKNPVRTLLLAALGMGVLGSLFAIREAGWIFVVGILIFMALNPLAEASEQTIIQRVVPFEKQGRVFGFGASLESAAAPISAFLIGPLAEFMIIPYMRTEEGHRAFGWLLGEGEARGIALTFVIASVIMILAVLVAFASRPYRLLSKAYADTPPPEPNAATDAPSLERILEA